jgi:organic radical activating enzyme
VTSEANIRVSEIFGPTIQGEGALIGHPTVFVRTGGCDYRCSWCDTLHAVDSAYRHDWKPMSAEAIMAEVERLTGGKPLVVSLSGGNPAIQPLGDLIDLGHSKGYNFALETQGSVAQDWFADVDVLTLSPKPPSSGMTTDWQALSECMTAAGLPDKIALKIVIFDDATPGRRNRRAGHGGHHGSHAMADRQGGRRSLVRGDGPAAIARAHLGQSARRLSDYSSKTRPSGSAPSDFSAALTSLTISSGPQT